jgi:hypothetical protein
MLLWAATAWSGTVTLVQAGSMGLPDRHTTDAVCDCVALEWNLIGEIQRLEVPRALVREVRHVQSTEGPRSVSLQLQDGSELLLEQAPCPIARSMAVDYSMRLEVPLTGDGVDALCTDVVQNLVDYLTPHFVPFVAPDYGQMAVLEVTDGAGRADVEANQHWSEQVPYLGRCFRDVSAPREVELSGRFDRDGMSRLRPLRPTPTDPTALCVAENLEMGAFEGAHKRRIKVRVGWEKDPSPTEPVAAP